ncbi:MAG: outer membrane protein assembly factor BamA [Thermodesulfobacteriota bacterium]
MTTKTAVTLTLLLTLLISLSPCPAPAADWQPAPGQTTLFLPLQINADSRENLTQVADEALTRALAGQQQAAFPRSLAESLFPYGTDWPPAAYNSAVLPATITHAVAGSLTRVGQQISVDLVVTELTGRSSPKYLFKTGENLNALGDILQELVGTALSLAGDYDRIEAIEVKGNSRIDRGAILRNVKSGVGQRYSEETVSADIKNIFKMGYFQEVRAFSDTVAGGRKLTFEVVEKEVIGQLTITGNDEIKEEDIKAVLSVSTNKIINDAEVKKSVAAVKQLYREKGYYNTEVNAQLSYPQKGRVTVAFAIKEGPKIYIKEIRFAGNSFARDKDLKKIIETSEKGFFSWLTDSGLLRREIAEQDAERIAAYYHNSGFIDARVGTPEIVQKDEWLYITYNIEEGRRFKVNTITIRGELIVDARELLDLLQIRREEFFSRKVLREDIIRLTDFYAERGYAFAEMVPDVIKKEGEVPEVDIDIVVTRNELIHINRIMVKGNTRTRDKVIRREIELKEGEIFNATALKRSNERIQRLDFFEDVNITPEPTVDETLMDILVNVKEKPTGSFSIGMGYSSVDDFMFMGEIKQDNFLGKGQQLALQADISGNSNRYNFSFTEPHLNDSELLFGFDLYKWTREYDDYTKDSTGFDFRFGYPIWERWKLGWSYGWENTDLTDIDYSNLSTVISDSLDVHITSYLKIALSRDTRNRRFMPSDGALHLVQVKYAGGPVLGGDSSFTKTEGTSSWYFPFFFDTTLHLNAAAGFVSENSDGKLPIYEKFYLGGLSSIRGFKSGQVSPRDAATLDRIGGDKMWYINEEIIFPLLKDVGLHGVVFLDAGNVYDIGEKWDFNNIKKSVGTGVRWLSPMGPLRLEYGRNLDPLDDEDSSNWDFSIGGNF